MYRIDYYGVLLNLIRNISITFANRKQHKTAMKKITICLVLLVMGITLDLSAQNDIEISQSQSTTRLYIPADNPHRPRTLGYDWIDCFYNRGELLFESSNNIDYLEVLVTNQRTGTSYQLVTLIGQHYSIYLEPGTYFINCSDGTIAYEGILDIP